MKHFAQKCTSCFTALRQDNAFHSDAETALHSITNNLLWLSANNGSDKEPESLEDSAGFI